MSVDVGTESTRAAVFTDAGVVLGSAAAAHETSFPAAGWAEQDPADWWAGLGEAVRGALADSGCDPADVAGLCLATTSCTVLACDSEGEPLRPALLWMDARSAAQAAEILEAGRGDDAIAVNSDGIGPISAEWMLPKALWLKQHEPAVWARARTVCECQDWLQFRCTGVLVAGGCNVATRWHCDGAAACAPCEGGACPLHFGGQPERLLGRVGLADLRSKWPTRCVAMGGRVGELTEAAAAHLGLPAGVPVAQGGADAFVGLVGLGAATTAGAVGLITGSSHLHLAVVDAASPKTARGVWGAYAGAPLAHLAMAEGGQSSTGAALQWARKLFGTVPLATLDDEAAALPVGAEGATALETFQGSRTPVTDPKARGAFAGLSLAHGRAHLWRALLEAVCLGTRASVEAMEGATGARPSVLLAAGGATRSPFWLQMHADATGLPVVVGECADAPLLGGAILAACLPGGVHHPRRRWTAASHRAAIGRAVGAMVRSARRVEPNAQAAAEYDALYAQRYTALAPALTSLGHAAADGLRPAARRRGDAPPVLGSGRAALVQPSLLSADIGALAVAARAVEAAGAAWVHVDIFDGSRAAGGALSSLGPASVAAVRAAAPSLRIDVHLGVASPAEFVGAVAAAGAARITFQLEACADADEAAALARAIRDAGCLAGVCLAVGTPAAAAAALVETGLVDLVDVLAVECGRGGQAFQPAALEKVRALRAAHPGLAHIMVDGGVDAATAPLAAAAGANVLVSGSHLFGSVVNGRGGGLAERLAGLERALVEHGE